MISNCGSDERGRISGGKAGDQTGTEWRIRSWYSRPWDTMLRHPDAKVQRLMAELATEAARNDLIGYDQSQRLTFWQHLAASNYRPSQITVACEADCSSGVAAIAKACGYILGDEALKAVSIYMYTGNERAVLSRAGFDVYTNSKYLRSDAYLLPGDVLLNSRAHTAINVSKGSQAPTPSAGSSDKYGELLKVDGWAGTKTVGRAQLVAGTPHDGVVSDQPEWVRSQPGIDRRIWLGGDCEDGSMLVEAIQKKLNSCGHSLKVDGLFGPNTWHAFEDFYGIVPDDEISGPSATMKKWQMALNKGRLL